MKCVVTASVYNVIQVIKDSTKDVGGAVLFRWVCGGGSVPLEDDKMQGSTYKVLRLVIIDESCYWMDKLNQVA